jgi:hypothetical protein
VPLSFPAVVDLRVPSAVFAADTRGDRAVLGADRLRTSADTSRLPHSPPRFAAVQRQGAHAGPVPGRSVHTDPEEQWAIAETIPGPRQIVYEDAKHADCYLRPDRYARDWSSCGQPPVAVEAAGRVVRAAPRCGVTRGPFRKG